MIYFFFFSKKVKEKKTNGNIIEEESAENLYIKRKMQTKEFGLNIDIINRH